MSFFNRIKTPVLAGLLLIVFASCEEDMTTIGSGVVGGEPFDTDMEEFDVFAYNQKIEAVSTNKLPIYQLGIFNDPLYGKTEARITSQLLLSSARPAFGKYSQAVEDDSATDGKASTIQENETVTEVILYIPYLTNSEGDTDGDGVANEFDDDPEDFNSDTDGDTISDNQERINGTDPLNADTDGDGTNDADDDDTIKNNFAQRVDLDSIYVNNTVFKRGTEASFNLKVEHSTYFLRDLDPDSGFQEAQEYFSSQQFSPSFVSDELYNGDVVVSDEQFLIDQEDDSDTDDVDESEVKLRVEPGIRVSLDTAFFQENVINKEGDLELVSQANFNDFLRGIHLSTSSIGGKDVMMLLDMKAAKITITYDYDVVNLNETADDTSDDKIEQAEGTFILSMLNQSTNGALSGNVVNTFSSDAYPAEISGAMNTGENAPKIYLKGGAGTHTEIRLFAEDEEGGQEFINQIKAENWIINEANLIFYVDRSTLDNVSDIIDPPGLYLYNAESKNPLIYEETEQGFLLNYGGLVEKSSNGKGEKYKIKITDHLNNIILRDSTNF